MSPAGPDWDAYFGGLAAFAGTLFALVLAARQIRGPLVENQHQAVSDAYLVDSIAVTVELGAAAALAILYEIEESGLFSVGVGVVAVAGVGLAIASVTYYVKAFRAGGFAWSWEDRGAIGQAVGNLLPLACYVVVSLFAFRVMHFGAHTVWFAAAVSWLTFSGIVQAIWWYARIWERQKPSAPVNPSP